MIDILINICGALAIIGGLWLSYLGVVGGGFQVRKVLALWVLFGTIVFVLLAAFLYFTKKLQEKSNEQKPFDVTTSTQFVLPENAKGGAVGWYKWFAPHAGNVSPIQRMALIRLTNQQPRRSQIETFRFEGCNQQDNWIPITWMNASGGVIYFAGGSTTKSAGLLEIPHLNWVLINKVIDPHETVEGWVCFEMPAGTNYNCPLRMYIKDFGGAQATQMIVAPDHEFAQGTQLKFTTFDDISANAFRPYTEVRDEKKRA